MGTRFWKSDTEYYVPPSCRCQGTHGSGRCDNIVRSPVDTNTLASRIYSPIVRPRGATNAFKPDRRFRLKCNIMQSQHGKAMRQRHRGHSLLEIGRWRSPHFLYCVLNTKGWPACHIGLPN